MRPVLIALALLLSACSQSSERPPVAPPLTPTWSLKLPVLDHPAFGESVIISQELSPDMRNILGTVAVDTTSRQVLWRNPYIGSPAGDPRDIQGNTSVVFQGRLITYTYTQGLLVRDPRTNLLFKTIQLPTSVAPQTDQPLPNYDFETVGDRLYFRINRHLFAYDMTDLINPALPSVAPLWQVNREPQGDLKQGLTNIAIDRDAGRIAYGLMRVNEVAKTSRSSIHVLDLETGRQLWEQEVYQDLTDATHRFVRVALAQGMAISNINGANEFKGYDQATGALKWNSQKFVCPEGETNVYAYLVPHGDQFLAMPEGDHCFSSWDLRTGAQNWVFTAPVGYHASFIQRPLMLNGVVYASNGWFWALDAQSGTVLGHSASLGDTQMYKGTPKFDPKNNQILVWGETLNAFRPLR